MKTIEEEKEKYPYLYEFLKSNKYYLDNIYVSETPIGQYMYIEKSQIYTKNYQVNYFKVNSELKQHMRLTEKVFIYPYIEETEHYNLINPKNMQLSLNIEYKDILRLYLSNDDKYILRKSRKEKIERLL